MAQLVKPLKVDLTQESSYIYMKVSQYEDNFRKYQVIFTDRGIPINNLRGDELITLHLCESGQETEYASRDCVWENGYPYITFSSNMLSRAGDIDAKFSIYSRSDPSLSFSRMWHLNVQRSLIDYDGMIQSSEFSILNNLIQQALMIPELIETFNLSQEQINQLIDKINSDIADYQQQFTDMKSQWTTDFQNALQKINTDISSYRSDYTKLKKEVTDLKSSVTTWYTAAQEAEETRISNENERKKQNEKCVEATNNANVATENANAATSTSQETTAIALEEISKMRAALQNLKYELVSLDGGIASTDLSSYESDYDGGGAS